jgi:hypothetical protein
MSDNAKILYAPDDTEFERGDKVSKSRVEKVNKQRRLEGKEEIRYEPYFKSVDTLNVDNSDWLTRITTNRVKNAIQTGAGLAQYANIAGKDPIPAYLFGEDFGLPGKKGDSGGFF